MRGASTAVITPFKADLGLDLEAFERLVERQLHLGVDGLVVCGSTGEAVTLRAAEREQVIALAVKLAAGRKPVYAGTSSSSTAEAVEATKRARDLGAAGALIAAPAYNKPQQAGLHLHFASIARAVPDIPIMIYNIPGRTAVNIATDTTARLVQEFPRSFVSYKDATGDLRQADEIMARCPGLMVLSGDDSATLALGALGAQGIVSVISNLVPAEVTTLAAAINQGNLAPARAMHRRLLPIIEACFTETNPVPVKAGCALLGLCGEFVRPPLAPIEPRHREQVREALAAFGLKVAA